jgi:hypothetical protein
MSRISEEGSERAETSTVLEIHTGGLHLPIDIRILLWPVSGLGGGMNALRK